MKIHVYIAAHEFIFRFWRLCYELVNFSETTNNIQLRLQLSPPPLTDKLSSKKA